jgi:biotin transport system substrate-specific component
MNSTDNQLRMSVYASLTAALIAAGACMSVTIGPVPIVLQNFFVLLGGLILGARWGLTAVGIYLLGGACGLPIFAGGLGGIGRFLGPTGGYLLGYLPAVALVGMMAQATAYRVAGEALALIGGCLIVYLCGVPWLKFVTGMSWNKALAAGMYPFVLGDAIKIAAAIPVARAIRPVIHREGGVSGAKPKKP